MVPVMTPSAKWRVQVRVKLSWNTMQGGMVFSRPKRASQPAESPADAAGVMGAGPPGRNCITDINYGIRETPESIGFAGRENGASYLSAATNGEGRGLLPRYGQPPRDRPGGATG